MAQSVISILMKKNILHYIAFHSDNNGNLIFEALTFHSKQSERSEHYSRGECSQRWI